MATKIKKNIEKGKDSVWFSDGEREGPSSF
jgi:hypothetical protein